MKQLIICTGILDLDTQEVQLGNLHNLFQGHCRGCMVRSPIKWRKTALKMGMANANLNWLMLVSLDTKRKLKKLSRVERVVASFSRLASLSLSLSSNRKV
ncbi:hypothetical protein Taro_013167 [Colocasia esculenta]|uniref:Uncharacterized protein n=1 Tax=Colocasia esculenta TaxID=4460 RepID=A0A843UB45_COLES|nr:hypothetical protein [Colocasia esculenta]